MSYARHNISCERHFISYVRNNTYITGLGGWHYTYVKSNKMEYTARRFFISFYKSTHLLLCLATATLDVEPDLISIQTKYTRGWCNCILCDITVSGGWYNCFWCDYAIFRVDSYIFINLWHNVKTYWKLLHW